MSAADASARELGRLRIRARRGMKELDVLLERYLDDRAHAAGSEERAEFAALLEQQDPVLAGYLLHGVPAEDPVLRRAVIRVLAAGAAPRT